MIYPDPSTHPSFSDPEWGRDFTIYCAECGCKCDFENGAGWVGDTPYCDEDCMINGEVEAVMGLWHEALPQYGRKQ